MKKNLFLLIAICYLFTALNALAQSNPEDAILGQWFNASKEAKIEIYKEGDKYFGKLAWMKEPNDENGNPKVDNKNPEKALQNRPLQDLVILRDFEYDEDNVWTDGRIYDPKSGKDYKCKMTLTKDKKLDVRGYIGISLFGRTETWTRAD